MEKYVEQARQELMEKSYQDIQQETAYKWAGRAYAAYEVVFRVDSSSEQIGWFHVAEEYRHEALEHASLVEDEEASDESLANVRGLLREVRNAAIELVHSSGAYGEEAGEEQASQDTNKENETIGEAVDGQPEESI